jgi:Zn-finger nucleic acid-binding protein
MLPGAHKAAAMTGQRPPMKPCPLCGVAMVASKSSVEHERFDIFTCLRCDAVISFEPDKGERDND